MFEAVGVDEFRGGTHRLGVPGPSGVPAGSVNASGASWRLPSSPDWSAVPVCPHSAPVTVTSMWLLSASFSMSGAVSVTVAGASVTIRIQYSASTGSPGCRPSVGKAKDSSAAFPAESWDW